MTGEAGEECPTPGCAGDAAKSPSANEGVVRARVSEEAEAEVDAPAEVMGAVGGEKARGVTTVATAVAGQAPEGAPAA